MTERMTPQLGWFYFDQARRLRVPELNLVVEPGESVALLGAKGSDVSDVYAEFNRLDPLRATRHARVPSVRCVTREGNLFPAFSAYDNFSMSERSVIPYSRKQLVAICEALKLKFGISTDFNLPIEQLSVSERIIIDVLRAYLSGMDVLVCDNLFSLLSIDGRNVLIALVGEMLAQGKSVLYLTTKWEFAVQIASRITVFSDHSFLGEADTESVKKNPQHLIYLISGRTLVEQYSESSNTANMLNMLYTGAEYLTDNYELSDALSFVIKNVVQMLDCATCSIYLADADTPDIHRFSAFPPSDPVLSRRFVDSRLCAVSLDSLYYSSTEDINFNSLFEGSHDGVQSLLCMPIVFKSKAQGLLVAYYARPVVYDEQQYLYLKSFCREIAIIIETSQLMGSSVLLQESNHRIKNNLQIIINLISIQQLYAMQNPSLQIDEVLSSIINRVQNIAAVHELLSCKGSGQTNIDLRKIVHSLLQTYSLTDIAVEVDSQSILIPYAKATSISMVINELVTNSVKYAFCGVGPNTDKRIAIACRHSGERIVIEVADNGRGLPDGVSVLDSPSIGFSIIRTIVKIDLHGEISIVNTGSGTLATVSVPLLL